MTHEFVDEPYFDLLRGIKGSAVVASLVDKALASSGSDDEIASLGMLGAIGREYGLTAQQVDDEVTRQAVMAFSGWTDRRR